MQMVAHGWLVLELTDSPFYLGLVGTVGSLPVFLLSLPSGVIADRFNKREIIIVTQTLAMVEAFILAALTYYGLIQVWHVLVLSACLGVVRALDVPARQAITIELVGKDDLLNGIALNSFAFNGARIVGPAAAGVVVAAFGTAMCFFINGISYIAAVVGLLMMRPSSVRTTSDHRPMFTQIREGIGYARREPVIQHLLILTAVASVFVFQYATIMPAFARDVFGVGARGLGVLMSGAGIGALISAVSVASLGHKIKRGVLMAVGSVLVPLGLVAFSQCPDYHLSIFCLALVGLGQMLFLAVSNSVIQMQTPDHLRGRILALRAFVFLGLAPVGAFQLGTLAEYVGVRESILMGGAIALCASLYFTIRHQHIRSAD